jgi:isopentenyl-diphosphate delta-isomerase
MEEMIEEVDWDGNVIATHPRKLLKKRMFPHKSSLILPRTKEGKIILCKRSKNKYPFPGTWCCAVGGKVIAGETEEQAALREMEEEVGFVQDLTKVTSFNYNEEDYKGLFTIFTTELSINDLHPDSCEIESLQEFNINEIIEMLENSPDVFAPTFRVAISEFIKNQQI